AAGVDAGMVGASGGGKPRRGRGKTADDVVGGEAYAPAGEGQSEEDGRKEQRQIVPEQQLDEQRRTPEQPDIASAHRIDDGIAHLQSEGGREAEAERYDLAEDGELDGGEHALEDGLIEKVAGDHGPSQ